VKVSLQIVRTFLRLRQAPEKEGRRIGFGGG
jgi:hypothetical protein